jgi:haloalkane dehalogenase
MSTIIKTPQERFQNLLDYPFSPNYLEVEKGLNMHYLDEGDSNAPIVLLLHGEPSWSYLYRKMIPVLVDNGFRAIAPDLIGFGKSDKITEKSAYSYATHLGWLRTFIEKLDLTDINLFCQDWGGLLGLRLITELEDRFSLVVASNTTLPTGDISMPESFQKWREFSQNSPKFDIGRVIQAGTLQELSDEVVAAYNAPFPSEEYKAGARMFPTLVPASPDDPESNNNRLAWKKLMQWEKPFLTIFGDGDDIMRGADKAFHKFIPGSKGQKHTMLNAGHFIQEEKGAELAALIVDFYKANSKT